MDVIVAENLVKHFGFVRALDGVNLTVPKGSTFGLIGPNGAGKTTFFGLVCGWLRPTKGRATVLGTATSRVVDLKGHLCALPQDASLPPNTTVMHSLAYYGRLQGLGRGEARNEALRVLDMLGLAGSAGTRASNLSHGMAKRVGLAQAFIGSPKLVLLDEPTSGLDPKSAHLVRSLIKDLSGTATVLVSSHNLHELEAICDHAAILDHGRLKAHGTMSELTAADTEVKITLANPKEALEKLASLATTVPGVSTAAADPLSSALIIRFSSGEKAPEEVVTQVLSALIEGGAKVGAVERGRGLEKKVLSIT